MDFVVEIDDDREGIPLVDILDLCAAAAGQIGGATAIMPRGEHCPKGARVEIGLTRETRRKIGG